MFGHVYLPIKGQFDLFLIMENLTLLIHIDDIETFPDHILQYLRSNFNIFESYVAECERINNLYNTNFEDRFIKKLS